MTKLWFIYTALSIIILGSCACNEQISQSASEEVRTDSQPLSGAHHDFTVYYKNNCNVTLLVYYAEIEPGSTLDCNTMKYLAPIRPNDSTKVIVNKGKIGYIVLSETGEGKCTEAKRRVQTWLDLSSSGLKTFYYASCENSSATSTSTKITEENVTGSIMATTLDPLATKISGIQASAW